MVMIIPSTVKYEKIDIVYFIGYFFLAIGNGHIIFVPS